MPDPPRLDCSERAAAEPIPDAPKKFPPLPKRDAAGYDAWVAALKARDRVWAAKYVLAIGAYESVVTQRAVTADCIDREREAGRIR